MLVGLPYIDNTISYHRTGADNTPNGNEIAAPVVIRSTLSAVNDGSLPSAE